MHFDLNINKNSDDYEVGTIVNDNRDGTYHVQVNDRSVPWGWVQSLGASQFAVGENVVVGFAHGSRKLPVLLSNDTSSIDFAPPGSGDWPIWGQAQDRRFLSATNGNDINFVQESADQTTVPVPLVPTPPLLIVKRIEGAKIIYLVII